MIKKAAVSVVVAVVLLRRRLRRRQVVAVVIHPNPTQRPQHCCPLGGISMPTIAKAKAKGTASGKTKGNAKAVATVRQFVLRGCGVTPPGRYEADFVSSFGMHFVLRVADGVRGYQLPSPSLSPPRPSSCPSSSSPSSLFVAPYSRRLKRGN